MPGLTTFLETPGTIDRMFCGVCDSECDVERNRFGQTQQLATSPSSWVLHDYFSCPYDDDDENEWHYDLWALQLRAEEKESKAKRDKEWSDRLGTGLGIIGCYDSDIYPEKYRDEPSRSLWQRPINWAAKLMRVRPQPKDD